MIDKGFLYNTSLIKLLSQPLDGFIVCFNIINCYQIMNEDIEARAAELDPGRSRTIGSYVIGTILLSQARHWARVRSVR